MAGAVALLLGMDAYANREIRNLNAEIAGAKRSIVAEVAKPRPTAAGDIGPQAVPATRARRSTLRAAPTLAQIARDYSIGSAETRNLPGR